MKFDAKTTPEDKQEIDPAYAFVVTPLYQTSTLSQRTP